MRIGKFVFSTAVVAAMLAGVPAAQAASVLYGVSGDGGTPSETLFTIDTTTAAATQVLALGNGNDGEGIGYNPNDGLLYHFSGISNGNEFFETVDPVGLTVGPNLVPGNTYGPAAAQELSGIAWSQALGLFVVMDRDENLYHVTTGGVFTQVGTTPGGNYYRGFAFDGAGSLFGVDPFNPTLVELDPNNGALLNSIAMTLDGNALTDGAVGLAVDPMTGIAYTLIKAPQQNRILATIDLSTGAATTIGTISGVKGMAGIVFVTDSVPEPTALGLFALGLAGLGLAARRRRTR